MISLARSSDQPRIVEVWRTSVRATHHFISSIDFAMIERSVAEEYVPNAPLWAAYDENQIVQAFIGMTDRHVDALFVHAEARGRGWGRALLQHAIATAGPELTVDVNEQNEGAVGFYQRYDFRIIGRSPRDDAGRPYPLLHLQRCAGTARPGGER